ncbi:MAG TPA: L-threonylcarbamoyladenylate synthase [Flavipsychrobacter sp.]|nr:L-threonylcarbamoyladenylate synthase [Flavipsychrobacter sp.]
MVDFENDIKNCVRILQEGGTILYPTDTVWGLGCDAFNEQAIDIIFSIKQRPKEKSLIILLADARDILQYVAAPPPDIVAIAEGFEEPTTIVYDGALEFPENAVHESGSIAIRVTKDPFCKALIKRFQKPIVSTSANLSGAPTPSIFSMMDDRIISQADYVVKYRQDDMTIRTPSRIVRINDEGTIQQLR